MGGQQSTQSTVEPWDGSKPGLLGDYTKLDTLQKNGAPLVWGENATVQKDKDGNVKKDANGNPIIKYSENKDQSYIADQSGSTIASQKAIRGIANGGDAPNFVDNASKTINRIENGTGLGTKDDDTLKGAMNGLKIGGYGAAPGAQTLNQAQNFNIAGDGQTNSVYNNLANQNTTNAATRQASQLGNYTNAASGLQQQQANNLSQNQNSAIGMLGGTANGDFLNGSPYLQQQMDTNTQNIMSNYMNTMRPQMDSQAAAAGRTGSGAAMSVRNQGDAAVMKQVADSNNNLLAQNYTAERGNMINAQGQIGNLNNADVSNALNANANYANTSNAQQQNRVNGVSAYGNISGQNINNQSANYNSMLNAANQMGNMSLAQSQQQTNSANLANNQYNSNTQNQLSNEQNQISAANSYSQNQNADRNTQLGAAGMVGQQNANQYYNANMLGQLGQTQDQRNSAELQADMNQFNAVQNQPFTNIANDIAMRTTGGYNNSSQVVSGNSAGQLASGLLGLLGLF
jgi:hypothetical protein